LGNQRSASEKLTTESPAEKTAGKHEPKAESESDAEPEEAKA